VPVLGAVTFANPLNGNVLGFSPRQKAVFASLKTLEDYLVGEDQVFY
jgi:hypothetical protein